VEAIKEAAALDHVARLVAESVKYWLPTEPAYDAFVAQVATAIKGASEIARDETVRKCVKIAEVMAWGWKRDADATQSASEGDAYEACLALDAQARGAELVAAKISTLGNVAARMMWKTGGGDK
jgi:hypothetical protein